MRCPIVAAALGVSLCASPAAADWKVESYKDRMTDRERKVASLEAKKTDHGIGATLIVRCLVHETVGGLYVELKTTALFTRGRMGLGYRIDDGQTNDRYMPVSPDRRGMTDFAKPREFYSGKRLRLELEPAGGPNLFYEFDLTGADKALRSIACKETGL